MNSTITNPEMLYFSEFLYNIFIHLYGFGLKLASTFNLKANLWFYGRKNQKIITLSEKSIWFHCASLGEFEQARPLIEKFRNDMPDRKLVLTFFSSSGYEVRKNYKGVDYVYYLPLDTTTNARDFMNAVNPSLAIFIKYEFWHNYLKILNQNSVPTLLVAANFRENQIFFKSYGFFFKEILRKFSHIFVQNEKSLKLLNGLKLKNVSIAFDTRFDTVVSNKNKALSFPEVEKFINGQKCIVIGSSWLKDEEIFAEIYPEISKYKLIIVPHEVNQKRIAEIADLFPENILLSEFSVDDTKQKVMIVDSIGKLTSLYRYADLAYIGGGFGVSIHNVLEAAVYGIPVLFGVNYQKSQEAIDLLNMKAARSIRNSEELKESVDFYSENKNKVNAGSICIDYVNSNTGGTDVVFHKIEELNLL